MSIQGLMERIVGFARFSIYETLANYRAERRRVISAIQSEAHDFDEFIRNKLWETTYDDRKRLKIIELICNLRFAQHDYGIHGSLEEQKKNKLDNLMEALFDHPYAIRDFAYETESPASRNLEQDT